MKRQKLKNYNFTEEEKNRLRSEITAFFLDEMDQEIGLIATEKVLDFFLDTLGESVYNKALDNALAWYKQSMGNLEGDYFSLYQE